MDKRKIIEEAGVVLVPNLLAGVLSTAHTHFLANLFPLASDIRIREANPAQFQDGYDQLDQTICTLIEFNMLPVVKGYFYMAKILS